MIRVTPRRCVLATTAVAVATAFLSASGAGSSAAAVRGGQRLPAGLVSAINSKLTEKPPWFGWSSAAAGAQAIPRGLAQAIHARLSKSPEPPELGYSVALSADGTTALVGAAGVNKRAGAVYVYHASDAGSWSSTATPTATLTDAHYGPGADFGYHLAISADGTTAFIGAPLARSSRGAIDVFHVSSEDAWANSSTPTAVVTNPNRTPEAGLALAVSADGTTLVVGAPFFGGYTGPGGAYVFHVASEEAWVSRLTPVATLTNTNERQSDIDVGWPVAISGDGRTALLGDGADTNGGGAFLFHVASEDAWTSSFVPAAVLTDVHFGPHAYLGIALALADDGTVALVGAPTAKGGLGAADVFHVADADAWSSKSTPTATLYRAFGTPNDLFGLDLALSGDGRTAVVAVPKATGEHAPVDVFHVASEGAWVSTGAPAAALTAPSSRGLWTAVSGDGSTALVGAPSYRWRTGAADVFHAPDASSWASTATPTAILTNAALDACVVPKLIGLTVSAAKSALAERNCRLGRVEHVTAKAKRGRIVRQGLRVGARRPAGTAVGVDVAK